VSGSDAYGLRIVKPPPSDYSCPETLEEALSIARPSAAGAPSDALPAVTSDFSQLSVGRILKPDD
jgi:hypothetical protein